MKSDGGGSATPAHWETPSESTAKVRTADRGSSTTRQPRVGVDVAPWKFPGAPYEFEKGDHMGLRSIGMYTGFGSLVQTSQASHDPRVL